MNYAVIGCGFIFSRHKQAIEATGGKILLTCDNDETKKADFTDYKEMFESPRFSSVDAVVICTPNYLHLDIARIVLQKGKKVLCEKPLSINGIEGIDDINTVLQLRYHPQLQNLKPKKVSVIAKMFRDENYWKSWKGDYKKSGGILYNLGIHYIDLLIYLLGNYRSIKNSFITEKLAIGTIEFEKGMGGFHIEILNNRNEQNRKIIIDNKEINLSNKDNLSYEDLHIEVYKHFLKGDGVPLGEAKKSLQLVHDLLQFSNGK